MRWGGRGIEVETIELRNGTEGRIFVDGLIPTEGQADLELAVTNFEISHLVDLLQSDVQATGLVSAYLAWHVERGLRSLEHVER